MASPRPRIVVLLATHNGVRWLPEQLSSILDQEGVDVRVIALDDGSTDGTPEWLDTTALAEPRLTRIPTMPPSGSSVANFLRLIGIAEVRDDELVAFADQDDIWMPGKLARHAELLESTGADGVSSNVTAFTPEGKTTLIKKSDPQRELDFLLQSPGPGSTFLISHRLLELTRRAIRENPTVSARIDYHDSYMYVVARAHGWRWHIDSQSTVLYRQHDDNVIGANVGAGSALARLRLIRSRWHRQQAAAMTELAVAVAQPALRPRFEYILGLLHDTGVRSRLELVRLAPQFRRRRRDRLIIGALMALGIW